MREFAHVKVSLWADDDYRALSMPAQWLYEYYLTSPDLNLAGRGDWRPKRIAPLSVTGAVDLIQAAADELEENGYMFFDDDTEEALIRTFVRHDGLLKQPKMGVAVNKALGAIASPKLRRILLDELIRLRNDEPELKGWPALTEPLRKAQLKRVA